jgi:transcriptional regulator with XRE-family HTH domain
MAPMTASKTKVNAAWFRTRLSEVEKSQRQMAEVIGRDPAAVTLLLKGERRIQLDEAEKLAVFLKRPLAEVLEAAGIDPTSGTKDTTLIVGHVDKDGRVHLERAKGDSRRVPTPLGLAPTVRALLFKSGGATDRWTAYFEPADDVTAEAVGRMCVVQLDTREKQRYIGILTKGYDRGTWNLSPILPGGAGLESVRLLSASVVEWLKLG